MTASDGETVDDRGYAVGAVVDVVEELLRARSISELTVAQIAAAAGISRTSFYAHFPTKHAAIARASDELLRDFLQAGAPLVPLHADDPEAAVREGLNAWVAVCRRHGALIRASSEGWPVDDDLYEIWADTVGSAAASMARGIRSARKEGQAPSGVDPRRLATCLGWGLERVMHVALVGGFEGIGDTDAIVEPLTQMIVGSVYGRPIGR